MATRRSQLVVRALLLASAVTTFGCGGKSRSNGADPDPDAKPVPSGSAGAPGAPIMPLSFCEATLETPDQKPIQLTCAQGLQAVGNGFYRLTLTSELGDNVRITFPSLEAGFFAATDCTSAFVTLSSGKTYLAEPPAVVDTVAVLRLERDGAELSGKLEGIFSDDNGPDNGGPGAELLTPIVRFSHIAVMPTDPACDCGGNSPPTGGDQCQVPICDAGFCQFLTCQANTSACTMK